MKKYKYNIGDKFFNEELGSTIVIVGYNTMYGGYDYSEFIRGAFIGKCSCHDDYLDEKVRYEEVRLRDISDIDSLVKVNEVLSVFTGEDLEKFIVSIDSTPLFQALPSFAPEPSFDYEMFFSDENKGKELLVGVYNTTPVYLSKSVGVDEVVIQGICKQNY